MASGAGNASGPDSHLGPAPAACPQERLPQISISPCLPPHDSVPTHLSLLVPAAAVPRCPWAAGAASHTPHREHKAASLLPCAFISPIKERGTFVYRVLMNGAVLAARSAARSHSRPGCWQGAGGCGRLLPQESFGRAQPLVPLRNCPTASHRPHLPHCRGIYGHDSPEEHRALPPGHAVEHLQIVLFALGFYPAPFSPQLISSSVLPASKRALRPH